MLRLEILPVQIHRTVSSSLQEASAYWLGWMQMGGNIIFVYRNTTRSTAQQESKLSVCAFDAVGEPGQAGFDYDALAVSSRRSWACTLPYSSHILFQVPGTLPWLSS